MKRSTFSRVFFIFFILLSHAAQADDLTPDSKSVSDIDEYAALLDFEGMPNTIIDGCVNVLTGNYFEAADDYVSAGPNPITVSRFYDSGSDTIGDLGDLWDMNTASSLYQETTSKTRAVGIYDRGVKLRFVGYRSEQELEIGTDVMGAGVVNVCSPYHSGRNHLPNKRVYIQKGHTANRYLLKTPGGESLHFAQDKKHDPYLLRTLSRPNGGQLAYQYNKGEVSRIEVKDSKGGLSQAIGIGRSKTAMTVSSEDGRGLTYTLTQMKSRYTGGDRKHRYALTKVTSNFAPTVKYEYQHKGKYKREHVIRKELPDSRYKNIAYCKTSKKKDKVWCLYAPVGVDSNPVLTHQFEYGKNSTTAYDTNKSRKIYSWNGNHRITSIEEWAPKWHHYRTEQLFWGGPNGACLKTRAMKTSGGAMLMARTYQHDARGNILKESLVGNLSGGCKVGPQIKDSGDLVANGCETFVKTYSYNGDNLVTSENDGRQEVRYLYYPGTALVRLKTILDKGIIRQRYYYEYDSESAVTLEITDNGSSNDINNLASVSERLIKRITTTKSRPKGLPAVVAEYGLDTALGHEVLIKRTVNAFTAHGQLAREEIYGSDDQFAYARTWTYDAHGNILSETDAAGRKTTYQYDVNDNCVSKQTPNVSYKTQYVYDYANRLIKEQEIHTDGRRFTKTYAYDHKGNRTSATDIYGNATQFVYDRFDRLIKRVLPPIPNSQGKLISPEETFSYDELNHPTEKQDGDGWTTRTRTTINGSPYRVEHPDGSVDTVCYNLDGTIKETIDGTGTKTVFQYDYQGRTLSEEKISPKGELLSSRRWRYNAFHLLEEIDPKGVVTTYSYDSAGRLTAERRGDTEKLYFYDTLGRQSEQWERCGDHVYRIQAVAYDLLDQIIEETTQSSSGETFLRKAYGYDVDGSRTHETLFSDTSPLTTVTTYDAHGQPLCVIAPDGTATHMVYNYSYRDAWGLPVPCEQVIDPLGNVTTIVKNTHDGIALEERKNILGKLIQQTRSDYDAQGHLLQRIETIISKGIAEKTCTTRFSYDAMGHETAVMEAYGAPEQKTTRREYNALGEVAKIFKPDGIILAHTYDALGRLTLMTSSNGTLNYEYAYDGNDNILWARDAVDGSLTERTYDFDGRVLTETLDNGLAFTYTYDPMGRLTEFQLPDLSSVSYGYDAGYLREVTCDRCGTSTTHRYHYDLSGKLGRSELMHGLGEVHYEYDALLRPTGIRSDYWQMLGEYDACGNLTNVLQEDPSGQREHRYAYDDLHQLTEEQGWAEHTYPLDSVGNRRAKDGVESKNNLLNQLLSHGDTTYSYNLNGNLTQKVASETTAYSYDALDRLVMVVSGSQKTIYHYDPFHRRTKKCTLVDTGDAWVPIAEQRYMYQSEKEIGAVNEEGAIQQLRVLGLGCEGDVGAAVLIELDQQVYVPLHNYRGDVTALLDANTGQAVESYRYTAYGEEQIYACDNNPTSVVINPWRFSSKRVDPETGWVFFGRRYYDPEAARWTTADPLWFVDGPNLYCYVGNKPTQFIDPEGLFFAELASFIVNSFMAIPEAVAGVNFSSGYTQDSAYVCLNTPTSAKRRAGFDQKSHCYQQKGAKYGPVYVTFVNGVGNSLEESQSNFEHAVSMAEGCSGCGVYNATHGVWDFPEAAANMAGARTTPSLLLLQAWEDYFKNCPDGIIIHHCHSQGTALTNNALGMLSAELRERIHVIAVAPSTYIDPELCGSVEHIVSRWDVVPRLDVAGRRRNWGTIRFVDRHPDASYFDHAYQSPSYHKAMQQRTEHIRYKFGDRKT